VSQYQKGKTNLDFIGACSNKIQIGFTFLVRDSEWQWHQLGHMQICTSLQTNNHASTPPLSFFTGQMPFLPPNQQRQSTEGTLSGVSALNSLCAFTSGWLTEGYRLCDRPAPINLAYYYYYNGGGVAQR